MTNDNDKINIALVQIKHDHGTIHTTVCRKSTIRVLGEIMKNSEGIKKEITK